LEVVAWAVAALAAAAESSTSQLVKQDIWK
jgi:hypothetical protein